MHQECDVRDVCYLNDDHAFIYKISMCILASTAMESHHLHLHWNLPCWLVDMAAVFKEKGWAVQPGRCQADPVAHLFIFSIKEAFRRSRKSRPTRVASSICKHKVCGDDIIAPAL